jgi:hypothetical protein
MTVDTGQYNLEHERLLPNIDLRPYAGQWVVLRSGRFFDSDADPEALLDRIEMEDEDVLVHSPSDPDAIWIK